MRRFRELVWIGVGLLCLAMQRRQGQEKKTGAHDSGSAPDALLLPPVAPARPRARLDQNLVTVSSDDRETRD